jgi:hypothetical protein
MAPALDETRKPVYALTVRFKSSGAGETMGYEIPRITGVTKLHLLKANISGITGAHNNLVLDLGSRSTSSTEVGVINRLLGFPCRNNCVVVECNGAANVVVNGSGEPILLGVFNQPKVFDTISLTLTNSAGQTVLYNECVMWLSMEVQTWQTN